MEPANGEPCVLAVKAEVDSLLAKLAVEFTLICAGHPLSVVLMHRLATNLTGTLFGFSFGLVDPFAVYPLASHAHGKGIYQSEADAQQRASEIGCETVHQNNGKWMPCADERELHRQLRKQ